MVNNEDGSHHFMYNRQLYMNNRAYLYKLVDEDDINPQHLAALKANIKKRARLFKDPVNMCKKGLLALGECSRTE